MKWSICGANCEVPIAFWWSLLREITSAAWHNSRCLAWDILLPSRHYLTTALRTALIATVYCNRPLLQYRGRFCHDMPPYYLSPVYYWRCNAWLLYCNTLSTHTHTAHCCDFELSRCLVFEVFHLILINQQFKYSHLKTRK